MVSNRGPSAYQPNALPLGQTGSQGGRERPNFLLWRGRDRDGERVYVRQTQTDRELENFILQGERELELQNVILQGLERISKTTTYALCF